MEIKICSILHLDGTLDAWDIISCRSLLGRRLVIPPFAMRRLCVLLELALFIESCVAPLAFESEVFQMHAFVRHQCIISLETFRAYVTLEVSPVRMLHHMVVQLALIGTFVSAFRALQEILSGMPACVIRQIVRSAETLIANSANECFG